MRRRLKEAAVVAAITLALLVILDLAAGFIAPRRPSGPGRRDPAEDSEIAYQFNDRYLVSLRPNLQKRTRRSDGEIISWETNSRSFRGGELNDNSNFRVFVYGDSNIQAAFSRLANTFPVRLQAHLSSRWPSRSIDVVNAGLAGAGPDQSLVRMTEDLASYRCDLVVLQIFADNDFGDLIRNRLFDVTSDGTLAPTPFPKEKDQGLVRAEALARGGPPDLATWFASLRLVGAVRRLSRSLSGGAGKHRPNPGAIAASYLELSAREYAVYARSEPRLFSHFQDHYDIDLAVHPESEAARTKVRFMRAVLRQVQRVTAAAKVELLVVIEPSQIDLAENAALSHNDLAAYPEYRRDALTGAVDAACADIGIDRINLYGPFMENDANRLYFRNDYHWNEAGQDLAAKIAAAYIADRMQVSRIRCNPARTEFSPQRQSIAAPARD